MILSACFAMNLSGPGRYLDRCYVLGQQPPPLASPDNVEIRH
jgi:hypothetical protein